MDEPEGCDGNGKLQTQRHVTLTEELRSQRNGNDTYCSTINLCGNAVIRDRLPYSW